MMMKSIIAKRTSPGKSIEYNYIKAKRKTVAIRISDDGDICVYAPLSLSLSEADKIVDSKHLWILRQLEKVASYKHISVLNEIEKRAVSKSVRRRAEQFLESYSGKKPQKIFIRFSGSRWGSCSSLGNISLNGYLISLPEKYFEYVLIHELTHLYHLNHSREFWDMMSSRITDWKKLRKELSQYKLPHSGPGTNH